jgi:hypothetical protein
MQNLCFGPECTISGYLSWENGFATKASILLDWTQNDVLECSEDVCLPSACNKMQNLHVWSLLWGTEVAKLVSQQSISSTPLDLKWWLGVFLSISLTFHSKKDVKLMFRAWMHYCRVLKFRKWFGRKTIHSTPLYPKWWLGVFWSISLTFET